MGMRISSGTLIGIAFCLALGGFAAGEAAGQTAGERQWKEVMPFAGNVEPRIGPFIWDGIEVRPTPEEPPPRPGSEDIRQFVDDGTAPHPLPPLPTDKKIWDGDEPLAIPDPNGTQHPFFEVVALERGEELCTGVIVGRNAVLTAAHCVCALDLENLATAPEAKIVFGYEVGNAAGSFETAIIKAKVLNPDKRFCGTLSSLGDIALFGQDLAVVFFDADANRKANNIEIDAGIAKFNTIESSAATGRVFRVPPARIATTWRILSPSTTALTAVGFGAGYLSTAPQRTLVGKKLYAPIPIISRLCGKPGHATLFGCAPGREVVLQDPLLRKDSCRGDSGGPAFAVLRSGERYLVGITSRALTADGTCGPGGIYSLVTPSVVDRLRQAGVEVAGYERPRQ